jgi:hypothetical protein
MGARKKSNKERNAARNARKKLQKATKEENVAPIEQTSAPEVDIVYEVEDVKAEGEFWGNLCGFWVDIHIIPWYIRQKVPILPLPPGICFGTTITEAGSFWCGGVCPAFVCYFRHSLVGVDATVLRPYISNSLFPTIPIRV